MLETDYYKHNQILAVSTNFPTPRFPEKGVFCRNILLEMARQQSRVDVIVPVSWTSVLKQWKGPVHEINIQPLNVQWPYKLTIPLTVLKPFRRLFAHFNHRMMQHAIERSLLPDVQYDFCYTHFFSAGQAALVSMTQRKIPIFLNFGESSPWIYDDLYGAKQWIRKLDQFSGIITVSKQNQNYLIDRNPYLAEKIRYIPNGVDTNRFKPMSKTSCRERLNLPLNAKIAIFCGHFIERKGPLRALEAIRKCGIIGVFIGSGSDYPQGEDVIFCGSVVNDDLPTWLNAADVFVLPSLNEGMSNAILEAMACGLPLVVSDRNFNREFLTNECAEFVDPHSHADIARGIQACMETSRGNLMKEKSLQLIKQFNLEQRVKKIFRFVTEMYC